MQPSRLTIINLLKQLEGLSDTTYLLNSRRAIHAEELCKPNIKSCNTDYAENIRPYIKKQTNPKHKDEKTYSQVSELMKHCVISAVYSQLAIYSYVIS